MKKQTNNAGQTGWLHVEQQVYSYHPAQNSKQERGPNLRSHTLELIKKEVENNLKLISTGNDYRNRTPLSHTQTNN